MSFLARTANERQYAAMEQTMHQFYFSDEAVTCQFAEKLADFLRPGDTVLFDGPLGAGKTTCARAMIQHLNPQESEVPSPTFTLVQSYDTKHGPLHHLDLYRLSHPDELEEIGWHDLKHDIVLVEWPERLGPLTPAHAIRFTIQVGGDGSTPQTRTITLRAPQALVEALL